MARRAMSDLNRRDINAFLELFHPDVEFIPLIVRLEGGSPYRGHEGMRVWWGNILDVFPEFTAETNEIRELGDVTVARLQLRGRGAESAAPIDQQAWSVMDWRDHRVFWWRVFRNEADALEEAGLRQ